MLKIILHRLLQGVLVILIVSALTFTLLATAGGDALSSLRNEPLVSEETLDSLRRIYELDQPLPVRYARWLKGVVRGEMGESFYYHAPVWGIIRPRLLNTLALATVALIIALSISLLLGSLAAGRAGGWADKLCGAVILFSASTPRIVLALVALAALARSSLMNASGANSYAGFSLTLPDSAGAGLLVPAFVLSVPLVALFLAQTREGLALALREDFVQVARSKGLSERVVILRHALRAALNPLITILGFSTGSLMSGSVIVETVLGWPGLGQLSVVAVQSRDVPLLMGVVLVTATAVLVGNLAADILLCLNDPRMRQAARVSSSTARGESLTIAS